MNDKAARPPDWDTEGPPHPILPEAWKWEIVGLNVQLQPIDEDEPYIDLTVIRGTDRRVLRFWSPQNLEIEEGGPTTLAAFSYLT